MKIVIQRVSEASVAVAGEIVGQIRGGLLLLVGIEPADTSDDIAWIVKKIVQLRIFSDDEGLMNCSLIDVDGDLLVISQFTLHASTKKGNRPSFMRAAQPAIAIPLYESLLHAFEQILGKRVERGIFGADMQVRLLNDGPVTIIIDSQNKE